MIIALFPIVLLAARFTGISKFVATPLRTNPEVSTPALLVADVGEADEILRLESAGLTIPVTISERRQITTMACSVRGVRAGRDDPELLIGVVSGMDKEIQAITDRYEGTRLPSSRNDIIVVFGYPHIHEDDVRRAAKASVEINALAWAQDRDDDPETFIIGRSGLHTADVVIDELAEAGDTLRLLGDNTAVAEWLQALAPENGVVVSPESSDLLHGYFQLDEVNRISHPRLGDNVPVFSLGMEYTSQLQQMMNGTPTELIGREHESGMMLDHWQTVQDGESQFVLLVGEPGMGKSTLLYDGVRGIIAADDPELITLNCESYYADSPLHPLINYFERTVFSSDFTLSSDERIAALRDFVDQLPTDNPEALQLLTALMSIETNDPDLVIEDASKLVREKTQQLMVDLLHGLATRKPLLLVVEDIHWADPSTLDLLERILAEGTDHPIFGLFTARPEFQSGWSMYSHVFAVTLSRLPSRSAERLIQNKLGDKTLPDGVISNIVEAAGGIPLYADQLIQGLVQSSEDLMSVDPDNMEMPASLHATLAARVDKLGNSKSLLQLCAVIGQDFPYALLREVVQSDNEELLRSLLSELVAEGMLFQRGSIPEANFRFKHRLLMDAAYQSLLNRTQQELHGAIGETLESSFPELCTALPVRLAQHFGAAGDAAKAVQYRIAAARAAVQKFAVDESLTQIDRAFELLTKIRDESHRNSAELALQTMKGSVLLSSQGYTNPDAMVAFERAVELSAQVQQTPTLFPTLVGTWMYYLIKGDNIQSKILSRRLLELAEQDGGLPEKLQATYCIGYSAFYTGELDESLEHLTLAETFDVAGEDYTRQTPSGDDSRVHLHLLRGQALWLLGDATQALAEVNIALDIAEAHPYGVVWGNYMAAWFYHMRGEEELMSSGCGRAIKAGVERGNLFFVSLAQFFNATRIEDPEERINTMRANHEITMATGARAGSSYLKGMMAEQLIEQDNLVEAENWLNDAFELIENQGERLWEGEVLRIQALLMCRQDESQESVLTALQRSVETSVAIGNRPFALRAALSFYDQDHGSDKASDMIQQILLSYAVPDTTIEYQRAVGIVEGAVSTVSDSKAS